jgi:hypothetical protein
MAAALTPRRGRWASVWSFKSARPEAARETLKSLLGDRIRIQRNGDHLEAALPSHIPAILSRALTSTFDFGICGVLFCSESNVFHTHKSVRYGDACFASDHRAPESVPRRVKKAATQDRNKDAGTIEGRAP